MRPCGRPSERRRGRSTRTPSAHTVRGPSPTRTANRRAQNRRAEWRALTRSGALRRTRTGCARPIAPRLEAGTPRGVPRVRASLQGSANGDTRRRSDCGCLPRTPKARRAADGRTRGEEPRRASEACAASCAPRRGSARARLPATRAPRSSSATRRRKRRPTISTLPGRCRRDSIGGQYPQRRGRLWPQAGRR